jgi:hypothetical protein
LWYRHSLLIQDQAYFHPRDLTGDATQHPLSHTLSMGRVSMGSDAKKTELAPGTLETLILKTLERNAGPMHGYGIAHYIKRISNDVLRQLGHKNAGYSMQYARITDEELNEVLEDRWRCANFGFTTHLLDGVSCRKVR